MVLFNYTALDSMLNYDDVPANKDTGLMKFCEECSKAIFTHPFTTHEPSNLDTIKVVVFVAQGK